ncbi:hypothetical protein AVM02_03075 [Brucella anthropi]|uniref:hypothetical protein n=1 Tax=Brucella anthropi TaxID=529 RepID=UPI0039863FA7
MFLVTVLKSGGEYKPEHVYRLCAQAQKHAPDLKFVCLADVELDIEYVKLLYGWPGWWSKMEMFRPGLFDKPFLYLDLDSTIIGSLANISARQRLTVLSDFYCPQHIGSGLMLVTPDAAKRAWQAWIASPQMHMRECVTRARWGDQGFLEGIWTDMDRWQNVLPGEIVSHKVDCQLKTPKTAKIICFHGKPRPWEVVDCVLR